jgi:hypothetical protein
MKYSGRKALGQVVNFRKTAGDNPAFKRNTLFDTNEAE